MRTMNWGRASARAVRWWSCCAGAVVPLALLSALAGCPGETPEEPVPVQQPDTQSVDPPELDRPFPHVLPTAPEPIGERVHAPWSSGRALVAHDDELLAADADNQALVVLDRLQLSVTRTVPLGGIPQALVVTPDGKAWVSLRDRGELVRVPPAASEPDARLTLGLGAWGLAASGDAQTIYVTVPDQQRVAMVDATTFEEVGSIAVGEAARAIAYVALDGFAELVVVHQYGEVRSVPLVDDRHALDASFVPLRVGSPTDLMLFPSRTSRLVATRALSAAVHPADGTVFIAHTQVTPGDQNDLQALAGGLLADPTLPPPPPTYYGPPDPPETYGAPMRPVETMVTAYAVRSLDGVVAGIGRPPVRDPESGEPMTHLLADPSDVLHHPTHSLLFVAGFGSDNVLVLNTSDPADPMASPLAILETSQAPSAMAASADGQRLYVLNAHDPSVSEFELASLLAPPSAGMPLPPVGVREDGTTTTLSDPHAGLPQVLTQRLTPQRTVPIGECPLPEAIRRGRRAFSFARNPRLSRDGHFSCNTCHPDGGEDKLVWVASQGPRQTPALAGRLEGTAPYNWNGSRHSLQSNMDRTVERMGGTGLSSGELGDLELFLLEGLRAEPNPNVLADGLSYQQWWGKQLFEDPQVGCAGCHGGPRFTSNANADVNTLSPLELDVWTALAERGETEVSEPRAFNVPSLIGLYATAPYMHDGSAATLMGVLEKTDGWMGHTSQLSLEEKEALIAYLLTL